MAAGPDPDGGPEGSASAATRGTGSPGGASPWVLSPELDRSPLDGTLRRELVRSRAHDPAYRLVLVLAHRLDSHAFRIFDGALPVDTGPVAGFVTMGR
jgi:hypothetical protein